MCSSDLRYLRCGWARLRKRRLVRTRSEFTHCARLALAIHSAGAYGMGMASNYNTRGRAAEILVNGDKASLVRRRETVEDQLAIEMLLAS